MTEICSFKVNVGCWIRLLLGDWVQCTPLLSLSNIYHIYFYYAIIIVTMVFFMYPIIDLENVDILHNALMLLDMIYRLPL
jgi:hypothetical protein